MSTSALSAYRSALRATSIAFKGDQTVLAAARNKIRDGFTENRNLGHDEATNEIKKMNEVSSFLIKNIVQGERQKDGNYFLKFHDRTELGDNESIKQSKSSMGSLAGAKAKKRSDLK